MTMGKQKLLCEENLRHAEYYGMLGTFDSLYAQSKEGREFIDLMSLMLKRENILLAYRNIKANTGSKTAGTDKLTIGDIDVRWYCPFAKNSKCPTFCRRIL